MGEEWLWHDKVGIVPFFAHNLRPLQPVLRSCLHYCYKLLNKIIQLFDIPGPDTYCRFSFLFHLCRKGLLKEILVSLGIPDVTLPFSDSSKVVGKEEREMKKSHLEKNTTSREQTWSKYEERMGPNIAEAGWWGRTRRRSHGRSRGLPPLIVAHWQPSSQQRLIRKNRFRQTAKSEFPPLPTWFRPTDVKAHENSLMGYRKGVANKKTH